MVVSFVRVASLECTAEVATIGLLLCVPFLHPCKAGRSPTPRPFGAEGDWVVARCITTITTITTSNIITAIISTFVIFDRLDLAACIFV